MNLKLKSSIANIKGVGEKYEKLLNTVNISTVFDLLLHFPLYYIDFTKIKKQIQLGQKNLYQVQIKNHQLSKLYWKRLSVLKVNAILNHSDIQIIFFNKPYMRDFFKKNKNVYIYGIFEKRGDNNQIINPTVFTGKNHNEVIPIYKNIKTLKSGKIRQVMENIFGSLKDEYECLPEKILKAHTFPPIVEALKGIHHPETFEPEEIEAKKRRFIYSEFLFFQIELQFIRNTYKRINRINHYTINQKVRESIKNNLEFELTPDQIRVFEEIVNDLKGAYAMQRLLQGDVGAGKTVVTFLSLLIAVENSFQGAFLAPTEILANQHFVKAKKFFKDKNVEILTASTPAKEKENVRKYIKNGTIDILFGTHALLNENIRFKNLSMIIIDEQHRFGVSQRAALYYKGNSVDLLVTTATPIPRTMLLSIYKDLSVSTIKSKPQGRIPNITKIIQSEKRDEFYLWLKNKILEGEKAFIIFPLIDDSDYFPELRSIETESKYLKNIFQKIPMGVVSGKTAGIEKHSIINAFAEGDLRILVSTTVIEVGIDIKDVTRIVIENADRYGLAQLHQLRGRVGRGELQSFCYLISSKNITDRGKQRLETIESINNGFKIAEIDLKMRGGGIITGIEQSGYLDFKIGDLKKNYDIFRLAQRDSQKILIEPSLQNDHISDFLNKTKKRIKKINFS